MWTQLIFYRPDKAHWFICVSLSHIDYLFFFFLRLNNKISFHCTVHIDQPLLSSRAVSLLPCFQRPVYLPLLCWYGVDRTGICGAHADLNQLRSFTILFYKRLCLSLWFLIKRTKTPYLFLLLKCRKNVLLIISYIRYKQLQY